MFTIFKSSTFNRTPIFKSSTFNRTPIGSIRFLFYLEGNCAFLKRSVGREVPFSVSISNSAIGGCLILWGEKLLYASPRVYPEFSFDYSWSFFLWSLRLCPLCSSLSISRFTFSDRMQEDHLSNLVDQWIRGPLHQGSLTLGRDLVAS